MKIYIICLYNRYMHRKAPEARVRGDKFKELGGAELERERHNHVVVDGD